MEKQEDASIALSCQTKKAEASKMLRFTGSYSHSLDSKGRLVIPQSFREKLGDAFCIAPGFDFKSIALYPSDKWEKRCEDYEALGNLNPALNRYLEQFYALSFDDQECDNQGRILLPASLRSKILADAKDIELTGANDHVRIVAAESAQQTWNSFQQELPSLLDLIANLKTEL